MDEETAERLVSLNTDLMMVFGRMKRAARAGAVGPVHPGTEFAILDTILRHRCSTVPEIASWRGVTRQSVQEVVNKLIDKRTLTYVVNPGHKSSNRLHVTPSGMALYEEVRAMLMDRFSRRTAGLTRADVDVAERVIKLIAETWNMDGDLNTSADGS